MDWSAAAGRAWKRCKQFAWASWGALMGYLAVEAKQGDGTQVGAVALVLAVTMVLFFAWGAYCVIRGAVQEEREKQK